MSGLIVALFLIMSPVFLLLELGSLLISLLDGRLRSTPFELVNDGDLLLLIDRMLHLRGLDTVKVTKVKGHADESMVLNGRVRKVDRLGDDAADEAADFGRRRVSPAVIDARRNLSGVCGRWYPVILDLHRFFIAISRAVVNHDGFAGTAPDPMVWSSGSILKEEETHDRTEKPVVCPQRGAQQFIIEDDETESELSLGSRSFLNRVNDQVRKRQNQSSMDVTEDSEKHSVIWRMFMSSTLQSSVFMVKNYSDNWHSIKNTKDLTMKQMFDISAKLVSEQDKIHGVTTINWESSSWKYMSLIGDEHIINLQRTKVYVFSESVLCLGKMNENLDQTQHGNKD